MRRRLIAAAIPVSTALIVAGCGSSSKSSPTTAAATPATTAATPPGVTIAVKKASFGKILAGANGRTLYLFLADKGGRSACNGACAAAWPPLTGSVTAGTGVNAALLGTTARSDGTKQVTYGGNPLYYYVTDKDASDSYGQALKQFGAEWYAIGANGKRVEKAGS
jgi:predicted lipoprotein with Yx(FWY)xxD motif